MNRVYNFSATEASREQILLRAGLCGPTGSGKSLTAIKIGSRMVEKMGLGPMYVIDTEHKSALRYAHSKRTGKGYHFRHVEMPADDNSPAAYLAALIYCEDQGAGVVVIDSWSHMWNGIGGVLEQVDKTTANSRSKNTFSEGWKEWTPIHARAIERVMQSTAHVIFTLRAKQEWVIQENERGKKEPFRVGLGEVARDGLTYEPDMFFRMDQGKARGTVSLTVEKSRVLDADGLIVGAQHIDPGDAFADEVAAWCEDGDARVDPAAEFAIALDLAVEQGIAAGRAGDREGGARALDGFRKWMQTHGVAQEPGARAVVKWRERVSEALTAKPQSEPAAQPAAEPGAA